MGTIWQWGLALIVTLQATGGPVADGVFRVISFLGDEEFYLLLFPTLLWCVDARMGFRLGILFLVSVYINSVTKALVAHPRPFDLDPQVKLIEAAGYGLPSGHAQAAVVIWGGVAAQARRPWAWLAALLLAGLIGFSRVYLGAHFPTDVIAGWAIGAVVLLAGLAAYRRMAGEMGRWPLPLQVALAVAIPAALALVFPDTSAVNVMGALAGVGTGLAIGARSLRVTAEGAWWQRLLRLLIGLAVLLVIYLGLRAIFPAEGTPLHLLFRFVRYALLGLWIGLGAPWAFWRLHLATRLAPRPEAAGAG